MDPDLGGHRDPVVTWTQTANDRSRQILLALDFIEVEWFVKYGAAQVRYARTC